jgi:hypothetical protein
MILRRSVDVATNRNKRIRSLPSSIMDKGNTMNQWRDERGSVQNDLRDEDITFKNGDYYLQILNRNHECHLDLFNKKLKDDRYDRLNRKDVKI